jgi:hypothetical protein
MQTVKWQQEIERSFMTNYIPVTPCNFAIISVIRAKEEKEGQINKAIVFEYPFAIDDVENVQTGTKILKGQYVPTFKNTIVKGPYRATISNPEDVERIEIFSQLLKSTSYRFKSSALFDGFRSNHYLCDPFNSYYVRR